MTHKTTNFNLFKLQSKNRKLIEKNVFHIIKSIEQHGFFEAKPIIVDENMIVIDGQHRLEACKRTNTPVNYSIVNGNADELMISLNMAQAQWKLEDYINLYAKNGIECYKEVLAVHEKYKFTISTCIEVVILNFKSNHMRRGHEFTMNPKRYELAEYLNNCKPYVSYYGSKNFAIAVNVLLHKTTQQQQQKVFDKIPSIKQQISFKEYLLVFENIINRYKKNDLSVKLTS